MQKQILITVLVGLGVSILCGCGDGSHATTADEKKAFGGGPMPPEIRKQFEADMKKNAADTAAAMKAKGAASAGH